MNKQFAGSAFLKLVLVLVLGFSGKDAFAQRPQTGTLQGIVRDPANAVIVGAEVTVTGADGSTQNTKTNPAGEFNLKADSGVYAIRISNPGFAPYEEANVSIVAGRTHTLQISLAVAIQDTQVTVANEAPVNTNPDGNASAITLKGDDLNALPDDPADLQAALQALAGPGAGPSGGEIFVDGFSGGKLPRPDAIREVRINQNPLSSEYDRFGLGRIEIFTKPGTDKWRGQVGGEFEDESLNTRNPFSSNQPPFQLRNENGTFSGPLIKKRLSFFLDFERENIDNNALINAVILGPNLVATPVHQSLVAPLATRDFSLRFDTQLDDRNTLVARYGFEGAKSKNAGLSGFDLPSRSFQQTDSEQSFRFTETAVLSPTIVNEARFQYLRVRSTQTSADNSPTVRVLDSFTSGGANTGNGHQDTDRFELQNFTSFAHGNHLLKVGGRLRYIRLTDLSPANFAGTFVFTSLDQYRNTILNLPGAFPTQFTITGGNPLAKVDRVDLGVFAQDDWRIHPGLTLSLGLRYETQTNISSWWNLGPRIAFAYAPGANGSKSSKTVFRGGFGVFYDRFSENLTLQTERYDGINQQQFVVTDPAILDPVVFTTTGVSNVPTIESLSELNQPQTTRVVAPELQTPYTMQTALSVERQLPFKTTLSATFVNAHTRRVLRSRNINAPLNGVRPNPATGNIFQYESTGRFNQNQLIINVRSNFSERVSIFSNYAFGRAQSDSDSDGTFPANSYDLSGEYGNSSIDIRHRFVFGGNVKAPFGLRLSPFISFRSGVPFNITTGVDLNGDALFTDRPSFATSLTEPGIIVTRFGAFDPTPEPGETIISRNYGRGPDFFIANLRIAKEFTFGGGNKKSAKAVPGGGDNQNRTGTNNPFGGGGGGQRPGGGGGDDEEGRYKLELSVQIRNMFNRTNGATPVGNLNSAFFGQPVALASGFGLGGGRQSGGNRRLRFEASFSF